MSLDTLSIIESAAGTDRQIGTARKVWGRESERFAPSTGRMGIATFRDEEEARHAVAVKHMQMIQSSLVKCAPLRPPKSLDDSREPQTDTERPSRRLHVLY